eukprot:Pompholyxophrys_punicea_v1_NODE_1308_length_800_cov_2.136913.p2 type:complete len:112 gc:universal NODE_1308_length_800_cov_2.136913:140-475(+)
MNPYEAHTSQKTSITLAAVVDFNSTTTGHFEYASLKSKNMEPKNGGEIHVHTLPWSFSRSPVSINFSRLCTHKLTSITLLCKFFNLTIQVRPPNKRTCQRFCLHHSHVSRM